MSGITNHLLTSTTFSSTMNPVFPRTRSQNVLLCVACGNPNSRSVYFSLIHRLALRNGKILKIGRWRSTYIWQYTPLSIIAMVNALSHPSMQFMKNLGIPSNSGQPFLYSMTILDTLSQKSGSH